MQKIFEALAEQNRREILRLLQEREMSAGEIASNFNISKPSISHHLNALKKSGLVVSRRAGQEIFYSLNITALHEFMLEFFNMFDNEKTDSEPNSEIPTFH